MITGTCQRALIIAALLLGTTRPAAAALSYWVDPGGWPDQARRDAAVASIQAVVDEFNRYGEFSWGNPGEIRVVYGSGTPTADAGYGGWGGQVRFGGTWPSLYVMIHEVNHWLGSGTFSNAMGFSHTGPAAVAMIEQFDGVGARLNTDGVHFWPYGHNQPNEYSPINFRRNVALMYALRQDWGIGPWTAPSSASIVHLRGNDPAGESGFNYPWNWSDDHFPQAGTHYVTGEYALRTPQGYPSWRFAGESLIVNNTNPNGGLLFNGWGTSGVVTIKNLILSGGTVKHDQFPQDLFQLAGRITLASNTNSTFNAAQGNIQILADVVGGGSLTKTGPNVLTLTSAAAYSGSTTINGGTLRLASVAPVANYTFDLVSGNTVVNRGSGGAAMNGTLAGGATIVPGGQSGNAVSLAGGASVNINNPIVDLHPTGNWTVSAWIKTATPGASLLTKGDGSGWANGNTIFYLGDGSAGGSGGVPGGVRYAGGFYQGAAGSASVIDNSWRHVVYVNSGGQYAIYVDGVALPLSPGNAGFGNADVGSVVRLGVSTNTVPADGSVNFNGLMDSVLFYNQALTAQQVAGLYAGRSPTGSLPSTTNVTIAGGATLDLGVVTQQIGSLTGAAGSAVLLGGGRLTVNSAASTQFAGVISGSGGLTKQGAGTLTLTGVNTYFGGTLVSAGGLRVNGSLAGPVTVEATATLAGAGTISGAVTVAAGGTLAPGASAGALTVGSLTLQAGSLTQIELAGPIRGSQYDAVQVGGALALDGALSVMLVGGYVPSTGQEFDLFDWGEVSGTFQSIILPALTGRAWDVAPLYATGQIVVVAPDVNGDLIVDGADLAAALGNYGIVSGALPTQGDANGDGAVDGADVLLVQRFLGASLPQARASGAHVPEPTTLAIAAAAWCMLTRRKRRRESSLTRAAH